MKGGIFMPKYFTCEEIASMYKVKTLTVWDWIRKKKLSAIKIGRDYRIRQDDIDAFEKTRKTA
jgi:excisionase family DNA binding protein